jgi:protein-L-isoaspartate(D-aspartate) O-methyltransferase
MGFGAQRAAMVAQQLVKRGVTGRVLDAFARVPREEFVTVDQIGRAYDDSPLPIGDGQTISQPYVVALTIAALDVDPGDRVMEIGTGSGYAAAILGELAREVVTIERIGSHADQARERLRRLGYDNVDVHHADGSIGWPDRAPYDGIAVAAGAPDVPKALLAQLAIGGRLVIPAGPADDQHLLVIERRDETHYAKRDLGEVRFVPLVGEQGWPTN